MADAPSKSSPAAFAMSSKPPIWQWARRVLPGVALCALVSAVALGLEHLEEQVTGRAWLEALVLAILIGTFVRSVWTPSETWRAGIAFSAKTVLEIAVVLLGASLSAATIVAAGPALLLGIAGVVAVALAASYGLGRMLGLSPRMAVLVACGNSICGNSAIAAVAPVIGANGGEVAASIAFTAVLGVLVVLGLPLLVPLLHLSDLQYGVLAGLTVYAVPQVLAATVPVAALSVQIGTLVKLVRVLMLGPVVLGLSLFGSHLRAGADGAAAPERPTGSRLALHRLVPWFILAFLAMAALRSLGAIPEAALAPIARLATILTIISMAALGLGVDIRVVARAGGRVTAAVTLSLVVLGGVSLGLIRFLGIG
ncbi:putative sulfate exporter family transporter [Bosea sp. (in: a-proteobacteria)]|uniref:YeiH family protein n=1 Tax=Bosea sp. (in: a-proteobacteria) TaxID=1871050 RepID=UPI001AD0E413|nr:putative sulfate exporter family transporter [Bosea sp. (in: a-proteobacteria)]MBN9441184.1 putative sulfate exporter family transporter [Bosea sp. (in: a-proteobacteria)]